MPWLPRVSGREAVVALRRAGFEVRDQRGGHIVMTKRGFPVTLSVPDHPGLRIGTLRALIRKAGVTVERFTDHLRQ